MSTDGSTHPTESSSAGPTPHDPTATAGATSVGAPGGPDHVTTGTLDDGTTPTDTERRPGWVARNTSALISALLVVIVAALAIAGLVLYRNQQDEANADTEAAVTAFLGGQGLEAETVECSGDTCAAIVGGQAATVLVQEDADGGQHFGISQYSGN